MGRVRRFQILVLAAAVVLPVLGLRSSSGDPGDLFPNVPNYDEAIVSPVSHPERTLLKPRVLVPPTVTPRPTPAPTPTPSPTPAPTPETPVLKTPQIHLPPAVAKAPDPIELAKARLSWTVDRELVLTPFLTADEQAEFDKDYASVVRKALMATPDERRKASDDLSAAADKEGMSPGLRRYLMLHAVGLMVRASGSWDDRRIKAERVVPLLEDKTVAIGQARVDCLKNLCQTVNDAPPKLLEYMVDSHLALARYQIQAGFGSTAVGNMNTARSLVLQLRDQPVERMDQVAETQAYVDRGATALAAWPRWQTALKANPNDPGANTFVAASHLAVYHDIERAAPYAAKSDKKEYQALAAAVSEAKLAELPAKPGRVPETTLTLAGALLDLTKSMGVAYDRFSTASLALEKLTALLEAYPNLAAGEADKARALLASARDVIDKSGVHPLRSAAKEPKPETPASGKGPRTYAAIGAIFKDAPKALLPEAGTAWSPSKITEANKWLKENVVGQILSIRANLQRAGAPIEKSDGVAYVPASFSVARIEVGDSIVAVSLDAKFTGKSMAVVRQLPIGQDAGVAGYITSIQLRGGMSPSLHITVADQAPKD